MSQNFIGKGEVVTFQSDIPHQAGHPYRIRGFNGVALINAEPGESYAFQLEGIFEFEMEDIKIGDLIYIQPSDGKLFDFEGYEKEESRFLFGRALTSSDSNNKFYCRLAQDYGE